MNAACWKTFYTFLLLYIAPPAWHSILNSTSKDKFELVQRSASRIIYPDLRHEERLALLSLPLLMDSIFIIYANHFKSISADPNHPLFNRVISIISRDLPGSQTPALSTAQRSPVHRSNQKVFFKYFMRFFDNGNMYLTWARPFRYYQPYIWIDTEIENKLNLKSMTIHFMLEQSTN